MADLDGPGGPAFAADPVDDWLEGGLPGRSDRARSIYLEALKPLLRR